MAYVRCMCRQRTVCCLVLVPDSDFSSSLRRCHCCRLRLCCHNIGFPHTRPPPVPFRQCRLGAGCFAVFAFRALLYKRSFSLFPSFGTGSSSDLLPAPFTFSFPFLLNRALPHAVERCSTARLFCPLLFAQNGSADLTPEDPRAWGLLSPFFYVLLSVITTLYHRK